jgi:hypothetical protein
MLNDDGENMLDKWGRDSLCCFAVNWPYIGRLHYRFGCPEDLDLWESMLNDDGEYVVAEGERHLPYYFSTHWLDIEQR